MLPGLKERLLGLINDPAYTPLKKEELALIFDIHPTEMPMFYNFLEELEEDGYIGKTKKGKIASPKSMGYFVGKFVAHRKGFGFVESDEEYTQDLFIPAADVNGAMHNDRVVAEITKPATDERRAEGAIIKVLEREITKVVGEFQSNKTFGFVIADEKKFNQDIYIPKKYFSGAKDGDKVVVQITIWPQAGRKPEGKIIEVLGPKGEKEVEILSIIRAHGLPEEFPKKVLEEAQKVAVPIPQEEIDRRLDIRDLNIFTIDGEDAKDLDDAISIERLSNGNFKLGVHIADVTHYVHEKSKLDKEALKRAGVAPELVDHVYMGCVIQAGLGQNVARQASLKAGLPVETPAVTVNVVCGSGLNCVNMAAQMIQAGDADIVVAGGMENMSMAPYALKNARYGYRMGNAPMIDTMVNDALWDAFNDYHMGITAENVAEQWGLTREQLDEFAAASQQKACAAIEAGKFKDEIVPVEVKKKKETIVVDTDEGPRPGTTAEGIARLRPAFKKDGIVTAANASSINDGAAAIVVMSEEKAKELGVTPMATWVAGALGGVDPSIMGVGPVAATNKVMAKTGLSVDDMDLIEANEAFAAQSLAVAHDLKFDMDKVNVNGGAIALGHPVGASGCRILVTLLHEMQKRDAKKGLATLCIGGGMGCATIVERD